MAMRKPAVAGQFYSGSEKSLLREVESLIDKSISKKEDALGVVSPHAGYIYSGPVAASVLATIKPKSTYIIMGPNHTGLGKPFSLSTDEPWKTPLGEVRIDETLADRIKKNSKYINEDNAAHAYEHSIEVQIPFLQVLNKNFKIVPIVISHADPDVYREIGLGLGKAIKDLSLESSVTIIASSDMTHYEPHDLAKKKDSKAIEAVLGLDEDKLMEAVEKFDISMCGYAPTFIMLVAVKELGATKARLVKYQTSGDTSGDYSSVVGYAGIVIS